MRERPLGPGEQAGYLPKAAVDVVHLIYRSKHYESQSKDYEFSRCSMLEHWAAGLADTQATLEDPRWLGRERGTPGVHVFDFAAASPHASTTITPTTGFKSTAPS